MKSNTNSLRKCPLSRDGAHRVRLSSASDVNTPPSSVTLGQQRMITGGAGGGPPQDGGVAGNSPDDGKACTSRGSGGALHIGQGLARDVVVAQSLCAVCPHGHDHASTSKMASKQIGQFPRNIVCDPKWLLIVLVVVMIIAVVTVFKERHMEENGQRRMETMLFLHRSPRSQAMFLQYTSMDHARVQALPQLSHLLRFRIRHNSTNSLADFHSKPLAPPSSVTYGASSGTSCTTPIPDVATPSVACLPSAILHK